MAHTQLGRGLVGTHCCCRPHLPPSVTMRFLVVLAVAAVSAGLAHGNACVDFLNCNERYSQEYDPASQSTDIPTLCKAARSYLACLKGAEGSPVCHDDKPTIAEAISMVQTGLDVECSGNGNGGGHQVVSVMAVFASVACVLVLTV